MKAFSLKDLITKTTKIKSLKSQEKEKNKGNNRLNELEYENYIKLICEGLFKNCWIDKV